MNNKQILFLVIVAFIISSVVMFFAFQTLEETPSSGTGAVFGEKTVSCNVGVTKDLFSNTKIDTVSCSFDDGCSFIDKYLSFAPLNILTNKGDIILSFPDGTVTRSYSVTAFGSGGSDVQRLSVCTEHYEGTITVVDEQGEISDTRKVTIK